MTDRNNSEHPLQGNENPKARLDELLDDLASDLDRKLSAVVDETRRGIDAAREVQGVDRAAPTKNEGKIGEKSHGKKKLIYAEIPLEEVENWIKSQGDFNKKLKEIQIHLDAFKVICEEISRLRGWQLLMDAIEKLPNHELADAVVWEKQDQWVHKQSVAFTNHDTTQLVSSDSLHQLYVDLHKLLAASQTVLFELKERVKHHQINTANTNEGIASMSSGVAATDQREGVVSDKEVERHRMSFRERLAATRKLIDEWKVLVRQSGMQEEDFRLAVAQKLSKKPEQLLDVRGFARELRELGERHRWEGETAKGDKSHVRIKMGHLEEIMPIAREVAVANREQPIVSGGGARDKDGTKKVVGSGAMRLEDNAFSDIPPTSGAAEREVRRAERDAQRLEELQDIVNNFREIYSQFQLAEDLPTHRRSYERYGQGEKAEAGKIIVPPLDESSAVITDPREILKQGIHDIYAEFLLAATPEKLKERASGKGQEGARRFEAYKNYLKTLYNRLWAQIEAVQKGLAREGNEKKKDDGSPREQEKSKRELERMLKEKLQLFVKLMNERLLQTEPGLSYARRRGRILAQMPEFAELILQRQKSMALSSDEQEAMIEKNTGSIEIPK